MILIVCDNCRKELHDINDRPYIVIENVVYRIELFYNGTIGFNTPIKIDNPTYCTSCFKELRIQ